MVHRAPPPRQRSGPHRATAPALRSDAAEDYRSTSSAARPGGNRPDRRSTLLGPAGTRAKSTVAALPAGRGDAVPATVKQRKERPTRNRDWDSSLTDLSAYKLTPTERQRRKEWYRPRTSEGVGVRPEPSKCYAFPKHWNVEENSSSNPLLNPYFDADDFAEFLKGYAARKAASKAEATSLKYAGRTRPRSAEQEEKCKLGGVPQLKAPSPETRPAARTRNRQVELEPEHPRRPISKVCEREVDVEREIALFEQKRCRLKKAMGIPAGGAEQLPQRTRAAKSRVAKASEAGSELSGLFYPTQLEGNCQPTDCPSCEEFSLDPCRDFSCEVSTQREVSSSMRDDSRRRTPMPSNWKEPADPLAFLNDCARSLTSLTSPITRALAEFRKELEGQQTARLKLEEAAALNAARTQELVQELEAERAARLKLEKAAALIAAQMQELLQHVEATKREQEILVSEVLRLEIADPPRDLSDRPRSEVATCPAFGLSDNSAVLA